jgi:hypothetical protein
MARKHITNKNWVSCAEVLFRQNGEQIFGEKSLP